MISRNKMNDPEIIDFINQSSAETKVYLGADSDVYLKNKIWYADYTLAVVVHKDGCHGARIFGETHTELVYDRHKSRPVLRLMTEVFKVAELYLRLADCLVDRHVEIHLDVNPDDCYASNLVAQQAIGYIKGVCGMTPQLKPEAFAASYAADRLHHVLSA